MGRDGNMDDERGHGVLIDFLITQEFETEDILDALKISSDQFPYHHDFVVEYCKRLFQPDEDLNESFDSDFQDINDNRLDLEGIISRLLKYMEFSLNINDEKAWSLIVNSILPLLKKFDGRTFLTIELDPRKDWFFQQIVENPDQCTTGCLANKLIFLNIILVQSKYCDQISSILKSRPGCSQELNLVNRVLQQLQVDTPIIDLETDDKEVEKFQIMMEEERKKDKQLVKSRRKKILAKNKQVFLYNKLL